MERSDLPSGPQWLTIAREELREAIGEAENLEFHHSPTGTVEWSHYQRLIRLEAALDQQIATFPTRVSAEQSPTKTYHVATVPLGGREFSGWGRERASSEPPGGDSGQPGPDDNGDRGQPLV